MYTAKTQGLVLPTLVISVAIQDNTRSAWEAVDAFQEITFIGKVHACTHFIGIAAPLNLYSIAPNSFKGIF